MNEFDGERNEISIFIGTKICTAKVPAFWIIAVVKFPTTGSPLDTALLIGLTETATVIRINSR